MKGSTLLVLSLPLAHSFVVSPLYPTSKPQDAMTLSANLVDRLVRVTKAKINSRIAQMEQPEKIIVQAVQDMKNDLVRVRQAYAEASTSLTKLQDEYHDLTATADQWQARATLALRNDKESLARAALERRQVLLDKAAAVQQSIDIQTKNTQQLQAALQTLQTEIASAHQKQSQLVARAQTARTTQQVNDMLSGLDTKSALTAFVRMESKVEALEAAADASSSMVTSPALEAEFALLEMQSDVDIELKQMKQELKLLGASANDVVPLVLEKESVRVRLP